MKTPAKQTKEHLFELDAVRAFALIIVVLFHLKIPGFQFGYLGVDLFFVLSGYLMTRNVMHDEKVHGTASVRKFIKNRVVRIVPPFVIVALVTLLISILIYSPQHLVEVGQQALRAITFHSNLYFYDQAGYFAPENELRPLLHSWSLAVEEQFYLFFALLILLSRYVRFQVLITGAFAISLILYGVLCFQTLSPSFELNGFWPEKEKSEAALFYLTPFRMIQFLSGACMALVHAKTHKDIGSKLGAVFLVLSIALLLALEAFQLLNLSNFVAAIAALLLLQKNKAIRIIGQLSAVRFIAQSSYQIYLVHWPLIVFWRYLTFQDLSVIAQITLAMLSILLGWGLMRLLRPKSNAPRSTSYTSRASLLAAVPALAIAGLVIQSGGYPSRLAHTDALSGAVDHRELESAYCNGSHLDNGRELGTRLGDPLVTCEVNPTQANTIYTFGDSHARHLVPGLTKHFPNHRIAALYFTGCHPQSGLADYIYDYEGRTALKDACQARNTAAMDHFAAQPPSTIILHQYSGYHSDTSPAFYVASEKLLSQLESFGHNVIWLGAVVRPNKQLDGCNAVPRTFPTAFVDSRCRGDIETAQNVLDQQDILTEKFPDLYLKTSPFFCSTSEAGACVTTLNGTPIFRDKHHLTVLGSEELIEFGRQTYPKSFPSPQNTEVPN